MATTLTMEDKAMLRSACLDKASVARMASSGCELEDRDRLLAIADTWSNLAEKVNQL